MSLEVSETAHGDVFQASDLATRFGLSRRQARLVARKVGVRLGRVTLITRGQLIRYLESHAGEAREEE